MIILYLLGNGFDLHFGYKTGYKDFYKYYIQQPIDTVIEEEKKQALNEVKQEFRRELEEGKSLWSDMEIALGQYAGRFKPQNQDNFLYVVSDIVSKLGDYLREQDSCIKKTIISKRIRYKLWADLASPWEFIPDNERNKLILQRGNNSIKIITFNYTHTLETYFGFDNKKNVKKDELIHIHGAIDDGIIVGVNDVKQIKGQLQALNEVKMNLIKEQINRRLLTDRQKKCRDWIKEADLICVYGSSLGATDKIWWEMIIKALQSKKNNRLFLFTHYGGSGWNSAATLARKAEKIKKEFLQYCLPAQKDKASAKTVVAINAHIFDVSNISSPESVFSIRELCQLSTTMFSAKKSVEKLAKTLNIAQRQAIASLHTVLEKRLRKSISLFEEWGDDFLEKE